jgi:uncharacterized protein YjbI with pentapeptide repeats
MANEEQLAILKQGVKVWNEWREKNSEKIDISGADLSGGNLGRADFSGVDLHKTNLSKANLRDAYFVSANLSGTILSEATLIGANFVSAAMYKTDFSKANLNFADFGRTELNMGVQFTAEIRDSNFSEAHLGYTSFIGASLSRISFKGTKFFRTNFSEANLAEIDLSSAYLDSVNFSKANLHSLNLGQTKILRITFDDVDLSEMDGLEQVEHLAPSSVGIDTIYKSKGNIPEVFLRGCGVPENMITFMHSLAGQAKAFEFYSCFISYSSKDTDFAERLHADLQSKGVRVWYFPEDAKWGETVWGEIDRSIKVYDKLIVVLSENSLQSGPVNREIERALIREDKEGKGILFPIRIDDYIFNTWEHERKADVTRKVVGDFSSWDKDAAKYDKAFDKLLKGLQAESGKA